MDRVRSLMEGTHIVSTPDGKSTGIQGISKDFETPTKQNMSTTNVFIHGTLDQQRRAVQEDLGSIPEVPVDFMLEHIVPNVNVDVDATLEKLIATGELTKLANFPGYSWKAFDGKSPSQTFNRKIADANSESKVFRRLNDIYGSIISCTQFFDGSPRKPTLEFKQDPDHAPKSDSSLRTRPDGYGVLTQDHKIPSVPEDKHSRHINGPYKPRSGPRPTTKVLEDPKSVHWFDIACVEEYKILSNAADRNDNVLKILWSLHHIMSIDHRRRFVFGITVEDRWSRIWFACRQNVFVTESFEIALNPSQLVRLIASLAHASPSQLGYDPTMKIHLNPKENTYFYYIECATKTPKGLETSLYRSDGVIFNSAFNLRGRATRVYEVQLLLKTNGLPAPPCDLQVLKDSWVDANRNKEGDTYAKLLAGASQEDQDRFLSVFEHGVVHVDDQEDSTSDVILHSQHIGIPDDMWFSSRNSGFRHNSEEFAHSMSQSMGATVKLFELSVSDIPNATKTKTNTNPESKTNTQSGSRTEATSQMLTVHKGGLMPNTNKEIKKPIVYSPKIHYRIVFNPNHGVSLEYLLDHGEASLQIVRKSMSDITKALRFMQRQGYVHRDISVGNIIWDSKNQSAKLADLEFAKPYAEKASSTVRTGTYAFMAGEVMKGKYSVPQYAIRNADFKVIYHFIHDLEALWWVGVYCLLCHYPAPYDIIVGTIRCYRDFNRTEVEQARQLVLSQQRLFPSFYDSATYEIRIEELFHPNRFNERIKGKREFPASVQAFISCLERIRKSIKRAYEEIQRDLRLPIADSEGDVRTPVHDRVIQILDTLAEAIGDEEVILWPLYSTTDERTAWMATRETLAKLRPRNKARGLVSMNNE